MNRVGVRGPGWARTIAPLLILALWAPAGNVLSAAEGLAPGKLLVASRALRDPNFRETVVLLVEYGARTGAVGLVLNRSSDVELATLLPELEGAADRLAQPVYLGGPVEPALFTLLVRTGTEPEESERVYPDVFRSHSRQLLERLVRAPASDETFRAYAGYAGWAPGQLEAEMSVGGWHLIDGRAAIVFELPVDQMWPRLILIGTAELARADRSRSGRRPSTGRAAR